VSRDIIDLRATMRQIAAEVAAAHGLRPRDIYLPIRQRWVVHPRQEAMARMSEAGFSHTQIVRHFGLTDHTTSVYAKRAVQARARDYRVTMTGSQLKRMKAVFRALAEREVA